MNHLNIFQDNCECQYNLENGPKMLFLLRWLAQKTVKKTDLRNARKYNLRAIVEFSNALLDSESLCCQYDKRSDFSKNNKPETLTY